MSALAPGLYVATVRGVADVTVMVNAFGDGHTLATVMGGSAHSAGQFTDARPLIVLDIHTWFPHRAAAALEALRGLSLGIGHDAFLTDVLEQITAQEKPARIPEPGLWGVVEAGYSDSPRCHYSAGPDGLWHSLRPPFTGIVVVAWDLLIDPVPIREGVTP